MPISNITVPVPTMAFNQRLYFGLSNCHKKICLLVYVRQGVPAQQVIHSVHHVLVQVWYQKNCHFNPAGVKTKQKIIEIPNHDFCRIEIANFLILYLCQYIMDTTNQLLSTKVPSNILHMLKDFFCENLRAQNIIFDQKPLLVGAW